MEFVDYYEVMGLDDTASSDEIKRTYRKLARKYHPDVSKQVDSETKFKELGEAYGVLKDAERRREYDELRRYRDSSGEGFNPPPGWQFRDTINPEDFQDSGHGVHGSQDFSDFFEQAFGSRFRQQQAPYSEQHVDARGQDVHTRLAISIHDAYHGATVELTISLPVVRSDGSNLTESKNLRVKIPVGIINGQKIRLKGQGGPGVGNAQSGDLYIEMLIEEDSTFHLEGRDVSVRVPIMPWEAALGAVLEVPTLSGPVNLTVAPNAKQGQRLRLAGRGLPGKNPGDQYAVLNMVVPEAKTPEQKAMYESLRRLWSTNSTSETGATV